MSDHELKLHVRVHEHAKQLQQPGLHALGPAHVPRASVGVHEPARARVKAEAKSAAQSSSAAPPRGMFGTIARGPIVVTTADGIQHGGVLPPAAPPASGPAGPH